MFKYWKEMRLLKKQQLVYTTALLSKLYDFVESIPDIAELATRAKDLNINDMQKMIVDSLVDYAKAKEEKSGE